MSVFTASYKPCSGVLYPSKLVCFSSKKKVNEKNRGKKVDLNFYGKGTYTNELKKLKRGNYGSREDKNARAGISHIKQVGLIAGGTAALLLTYFLGCGG